MARITSKGQVTVPKPVREALGLRAGDGLRFEREGDRIVVSKQGDLGALAGSVEVPDAIRGASWEQIRAASRAAWGLESERRGRGAG